jgi:predicted O-methyltransferase YrrM
MRYSRPQDHTLDKFGGPDEPWITRAAISFLQSYLKNDMIAAEFGSGSSTRWISERVKRLVSIENEKVWYTEVSEDIKDLSNIDYRLIEYIDSEESKNKYSKALSEFEDSLFDFILIDGRLRVRSLIESYKKVKINGILMFDNAERYFNAQGIPWYKKAIDFIDLQYNWLKTETDNGIIKTIWWKRES